MDLLDFSECKLYFEEDLPPEAEELLAQASLEYGQPEAEIALLRANLMVPDTLTVLVGLYRFYFYQHRLEEALRVAERAMYLSGRQLSLPDWESLDEGSLAIAAAISFGLLRFYLLALKAASVVLLRLGRIEESRARLHVLAEVDTRDQLGASKLLEVIATFEDPDESDLSLAVA